MKKMLLLSALLCAMGSVAAQSDTDKSHKQGERKSPDVEDNRKNPSVNNSNKDMGYNSSRKTENDPAPKKVPQKNECPSCK
ncbi:hypothetical protein [Janthinobacterium sp. TND4EL3]|uniref:hypothetical protein n=1 Tax=Janthinobacterium sp. TND4EL3 TaxID=1907311 RepID=UPI00111552B1|nr:hypothetical protein [Janthinobacterium sp. TND4EL3]